MCDVDVTQDKVLEFQNGLFQGKKRASPTVIIMVGGPGSGKSNAQKECITQLKMEEDDFVIIDPDSILSKVFQNNNACYWKSGVDHVTPKRGDYDVAVINNENFAFASSNKYNIVYDSTGVNPTWIIGSVIPILKTNGYRIIMCINILNSGEAIKRAKEREQRTGRAVDKEYLENIYSKLEKVIPEYLETKKDTIDAIFVYDNSGSQLVLLLDKYDDKIRCYKDKSEIASILPSVQCNLVSMVDCKRRALRMTKSAYKSGA